MDADSLWKAFGHVVTAAVKHGEKQPSGNGDRRGSGPAGGFGDATGAVRIKVGGGTKTPCCVAKRPGQK